MGSGFQPDSALRDDRRGITTTQANDSLNRLTSKTYTDGTPPVARTYCGAEDFVNTISTTATATAPVTSYNYAHYDELGRAGRIVQTTGTRTYTFSNLSWSPPGAAIERDVSFGAGGDGPGGWRGASACKLTQKTGYVRHRKHQSCSRTQGTSLQSDQV